MKHLGAYYNDPTLKASVLEKILAHQQLEQIVQGATGENGTGCLIWCGLGVYDHESYAQAFNVPIMIPYLGEHLFERSCTEESVTIPYRFMDAIPVGVSWEAMERVWPKLCVNMLLRYQNALPKEAIGMREAIQQTIEVYQHRLQQGEFNRQAAEIAAEAARSSRFTKPAKVAAYAAMAAATEDAPLAAWAAARSAVWAAESATDFTGEFAEIQWQLETILALLRECSPEGIQAEHEAVIVSSLNQEKGVST